MKYISSVYIQCRKFEFVTPFTLSSYAFQEKLMDLFVLCFHHVFNFLFSNSEGKSFDIMLWKNVVSGT